MNDPNPEPIEVEIPPLVVPTCTIVLPGGERWIFNLTKARLLAASSRDKYWLPRSAIEPYLVDRALDRHLVDEADVTIPGIGVMLDYGGQRKLVLIDGLERAARAWMTDQGYAVYVLTDNERDGCLWSKKGVEGIKEKLEGGLGL